MIYESSKFPRIFRKRQQLCQEVVSLQLASQQLNFSLQHFTLLPTTTSETGLEVSQPLFNPLHNLRAVQVWGGLVMWSLTSLTLVWVRIDLNSEGTPGPVLKIKAHSAYVVVQFSGWSCKYLLASWASAAKNGWIGSIVAISKNWMNEQSQWGWRLWLKWTCATIDLSGLLYFRWKPGCPSHRGSATASYLATSGPPCLALS